MMDWVRLLNDERFSKLLKREKPVDRPIGPSFASTENRLAQERDHDRILFSAPFRRMGDKTQVFPLESIESIRTRLTHSYEVANLARSLGRKIAETLTEKLPGNAIRTIPATLAAVGLAHDIGNPPFGHQGELAIRAWFKKNAKELFECPVSPPDSNLSDVQLDVNKLTEQQKNDFLLFEGNAQTLRILTKLQVIDDDLGLNLSVSTLASIMKYVAASDKTEKSKQPRKKVGFFASECSLVERIRGETGLEGDARHPLALVMEASDDIAYSVLDAEDAIKKGIVSLNDLLAALESLSGSKCESDAVITHLCELARWELKNLTMQNLHPSELQDVATTKFRVHAIHLMVSAVGQAFSENYDDIMSGEFEDELINVSEASLLCRELKKFDRENVFSHKSVLEIELNGFNILNRLMDFLWIGISERKNYEELSSKRQSPFAAYVYSRISKNYRRVFEGKVHHYHREADFPIRYKEMQLLTDMVSGMTDQFCIDLHRELERHYRGTR